MNKFPLKHHKPLKKTQILVWKSWIKSDVYISCLNKFDEQITLKWEFKTLNKTEYSFPKIDDTFFWNFIPEFTLGNMFHICDFSMF